MREAEKALAAIEERLSLIYRLCCGTAPKQSVGELVAVMQTMPEWGVVRAQLAAPADEALKAERDTLAHGVRIYTERIAELEAQLAAPEAWTDEQIVALLASLGIDADKSKYGFPELQVGTNVPGIRKIIERAAQLAAPGAPEPKKADFYCFPAGTYPIDKPAPGARQPVAWLWIEHGKPVNALLRRPNPDDLYWKEKGFTAEPLFRA